MSKWKLAILVIIVTLVQAYFLSAFSSSLLVPNLAVVLIAYIAIKRTPRLSITMALLAGFVLDIAAGQLGPRMLVLLGVVGIVLLLKRWGLEMQRLGTQLAVIALGCLLYNFLGLGLGWADVGEVSWSWSLGGWWLFEALWTLTIAVLVQKRLQQALQARGEGLYL